MQFHQHKLPNGLTIIGETIPAARAAALGFWVRTGARDETPEISGATHFLEHMIFKGSDKRDALAVNRDLDRIGSNHNAFTSQENTVFYCACLPEYLPRAVEIFSDILRPSLRPDDFDTEKQVILEEISMYEDQPPAVAWERAQQLFYDGHGLGNLVLGTTASVTALTRDQMYAYFRRRYVAPNITVAAAGNFDWPAFVRLVEEHCGGWEAGPVGREGVREPPGSGRFSAQRKEGVAQEHVILLAAGPSADSPLRHAASVLTVAVGDDTNSRLYWELVDPGLVESAGSGLSVHEGAGLLHTSFSCEPELTEEDLGRVHRVLSEVQRDGITEAELQQTKNKVLSHLVRAGEKSMRRMLEIGEAWTYLGKYRSLDDDLRDYEAVTLAAVREVLERYPLTRLTTLALGPLAELKNPSH